MGFAPKTQLKPIRFVETSFQLLHPPPPRHPCRNKQSARRPPQPASPLRRRHNCNPAHPSPRLGAPAAPPLRRCLGGFRQVLSPCSFGCPILLTTTTTAPTTCLCNFPALFLHTVLPLVLPPFLPLPSPGQPIAFPFPSVSHRLACHPIAIPLPSHAISLPIAARWSSHRHFLAIPFPSPCLSFVFYCRPLATPWPSLCHPGRLVLCIVLPPPAEDRKCSCSSSCRPGH